MKSFFYKSLSISLTYLLIFGCSFPTNNTQSTQKTVIKKIEPKLRETKIVLARKDEKGVVNPIVPSDIKSLEINGTKVDPKDIQISKKDEEQKSKVKFDGTGTFDFKTVDKETIKSFVDSGIVDEKTVKEVIETGKITPDVVKQVVSSGLIDEKTLMELIGTGTVPQTDVDLVKLQLNDAKDLVSIPIFKDKAEEGFKTKAVQNSSVQVVIQTDADGNVTEVNGVYDKDGNGKADDNEASFNIDIKNDSFTLFKPNNESETLDLKTIFTKETISPEDIKKQVKDDAEAAKAMKESRTNFDPLDDYVGLWNNSTIGNQIKFTIRRGNGQNVFRASATFNSKTYSKEAQVATEGSNVILNLEGFGKFAKIVIAKESPNDITLTIQDTNVSELAQYRGFPFLLSRDQ